MSSKRYRDNISISVPGLSDEIDLDYECWCCNNSFSKRIPSELDENGECRFCGGTGFIMTEAGEAIMELLQRYGKKDAPKND